MIGQSSTSPPRGLVASSRGKLRRVCSCKHVSFFQGFNQGEGGSRWGQMQTEWIAVVLVGQSLQALFLLRPGMRISTRRNIKHYTALVRTPLTFFLHGPGAWHSGSCANARSWVRHSRGSHEPCRTPWIWAKKAGSYSSIMVIE